MNNSKWFSLEELVPKEIYETEKDCAWQYISPKLIVTIDIVREILGVPLICNNWKWGGSRNMSGFRPQTSTVGVSKSQHKLGCAVDLISTKMTAKEMRDKLVENQDKLPFPIRIEKWNSQGQEISWLHIDVKEHTSKNKIYFFKA